MKPQNWTRQQHYRTCENVCACVYVSCLLRNHEQRSGFPSREVKMRGLLAIEPQRSTTPEDSKLCFFLPSSSIAHRSTIRILSPGLSKASSQKVAQRGIFNGDIQV